MMFEACQIYFVEERSNRPPTTSLWKLGSEMLHAMWSL